MNDEALFMLCGFKYSVRDIIYKQTGDNFQDSIRDLTSFPSVYTVLTTRQSSVKRDGCWLSQLNKKKKAGGDI